MSQREAAQDSGETVHEFSWKLFLKDFETHYYEKDLPVFIKKIRSEIMQLTLETAGHAIGVSKSHGTH